MNGGKKHLQKTLLLCYFSLGALVMPTNAFEDSYSINQANTYKVAGTGKMQDGRLVVDEPNPLHFENRDPRLYTTLFVPGMMWNGKGGEGEWYGGGRSSFSTVYVMKYFDTEDTKTRSITGRIFI